MSAEFDPDNPKTIGQHIRKFLADLRLARQVQADFSDQEAINRDYQRAIAAEQAAEAAAWEQMRADGIPVAPPETDPEAAAEWLDEWDSADSDAYQARVEAGIEPEAEP